MRVNLIKNKDVLWLALIFVAGMIPRLWQAGVGFWHDETASLIISTGSVRDILVHIKGDFHPPLFYVLLGKWVELVGRNEALIRMPFILLSALSIPLTYLLVKQLTGSKKTGLWASMLLAANPLHVYYSTELRMYGIATTLAVASWYLLIAGKTRRDLVTYIVVTLLGTFTFYGLWLMVVSQVVVLIWQKRYRWLGTLVLVSGGMLVWWWPVLSMQLMGGSFMQESLPGWARLSGDLSLKSVVMIPLKWVVGRVNLSGDTVLTLSSLGAVAYVVFVGLWSIKSKKSWVLLISIFVPLTLAIILSVKSPMLGYWRYVFLLPMFCGLLAFGLSQMDRYNQYLNMGALVTIFVFCNIAYFMIPRYWREDWKGAGEFFGSRDGQKIVSIYSFFDAVPGAKWYLGYANGVGVIREIRAGSDKFDARMRELTWDKETILVFDYLNDLTDPNRSVKQWMNKAGYIVSGTYVFRGVGEVVEYKPREK